MKSKFNFDENALDDLMAEFKTPKGIYPAYEVLMRLPGMDLTPRKARELIGKRATNGLEEYVKDTWPLSFDMPRFKEAWDAGKINL